MKFCVIVESRAFPEQNHALGPYDTKKAAQTALCWCGNKILRLSGQPEDGMWETHTHLLHILPLRQCGPAS